VAVVADLRGRFSEVLAKQREKANAEKREGSNKSSMDRRESCSSKENESSTTNASAEGKNNEGAGNGKSSRPAPPRPSAEAMLQLQGMVRALAS
jgi:hypothetical protein